MIGLLDADIIPYEFGAAKGEDGDPLPLNLTIARVYERIEMIQERSGVDKLEFHLSGPENFRVGLATIVPYKGQRPVEKSKHWAAIRHEIKNNCDAIMSEGIEADDAICIRQYEQNKIDDANAELDFWDYGTAILSRDKDLGMRAGKHYGWQAGNCKEKPLWLQTEIGGLRCFYKQLLTGDTVDNIKGLYGVGEKSKLVKDIDDMDAEWDMAQHVYEKYEDRFGAYASKFMTENGRLLWMLRTKEDVWEMPVIDTLIKQLEI